MVRFKPERADLCLGVALICFGLEAVKSALGLPTDPSVWTMGGMGVFTWAGMSRNSRSRERETSSKTDDTDSGTPSSKPDYSSSEQQSDR